MIHSLLAHVDIYVDALCWPQLFIFDVNLTLEIDDCSHDFAEMIDYGKFSCI